MKKKYLGVLIVIITTMMPIGCSRASSENVLLGTEKIIINENTKEKKNGDFKIEMVAETEDINPGSTYWMLGVKENIIQLIYEYPDNNIREVRVGKLDSDNKINWTNKNVDWGIYTNYAYNGLYPTKIKKDNKVYTINKDGELEELVGYTKLIEEQGNVLENHYSYRNGSIDVVEFGNEQYPKLAVIDIPNEKYYVLPNELSRNDKDGGLSQILGIDGDRIYVSYVYLTIDNSIAYEVNKGEELDISNYVKTTMGYIENNKFTKILSVDDGIKIDNGGEMLYENGKILFSGLAEGKNGIWNYDIDNKKLTKIVGVDSEIFFEFHINENKDKVVISSLEPDLEKDEKQNITLSIANINEKLEITNITNIVTDTEERYHKAFAGWANGGKTFYIRSTAADENYNGTNKLEIYDIVE